MTQLVSKVQYRNFETGEFVDEEEHDYKSTIRLIENFPLEEKRKMFCERRSLLHDSYSQSKNDPAFFRNTIIPAQ